MKWVGEIFKWLVIGMMFGIGTVSLALLLQVVIVKLVI